MIARHKRSGDYLESKQLPNDSEPTPNYDILHQQTKSTIFFFLNSRNPHNPFCYIVKIMFLVITYQSENYDRKYSDIFALGFIALENTIVVKHMQVRFVAVVLVMR